MSCMDDVESILALDAGQTGIRTALHHQPGSTLAEGERSRQVEVREYDGVMTDRPVLPQLAEVARRSLEGVDAQAVVLAIGSSGLTDDMRAEDLLALLDGTPVREVRLAHDSITSYLGALGDTPGVVVAAGTGVVTLAVGASSVARVDGWGYLLGDAGSGFWIGRAGLDAVMRAHDGRGPATALTEPATREFDDLEGAYMVLQADEHKVSRIAAWARTVAELADDDQVCREVCERAGVELGTSAVAGLRRVGEDTRPDPVVSTVGKVFGSTHVRGAFEQHLRQAFPGVRLQAAQGTGLDGAARLGILDDTSPLFAHLRRASHS